MKLHLARPGDTKLFTAHGADHVMINGERFETSVVIHANEVRSDWQASDFDALTESDFTYFLDLKPDVLLFGTGAQQRFAHPHLYRSLTGAGIAVEFMSTPAVCRTYNILVAEDRKVAAAVLL